VGSRDFPWHRVNNELNDSLTQPYTTSLPIAERSLRSQACVKLLRVSVFREPVSFSFNTNCTNQKSAPLRDYRSAARGNHKHLVLGGGAVKKRHLTPVFRPGPFGGPLIDQGWTYSKGSSFFLPFCFIKHGRTCKPTLVNTSAMATLPP